MIAVGLPKFPFSLKLLLLKIITSGRLFLVSIRLFKRSSLISGLTAVFGKRLLMVLLFRFNGHSFRQTVFQRRVKTLPDRFILVTLKFVVAVQRKLGGIILIEKILSIQVSPCLRTGARLIGQFRW